MTRAKSKLGSRFLASAGLLAAAAGALGGIAAPAQAADWNSCTETSPASNDPGGVYATAALTTGSCSGGTSYSAHFAPSGEVLTISDSMGDGHAAKVTLAIIDKSGDQVYRNTYYAGVEDSPAKVDLDSKGSVNNVPEGYTVTFKVCINETSTCSKWVSGTA